MLTLRFGAATSPTLACFSFGVRVVPSCSSCVRVALNSSITRLSSASFNLLSCALNHGLDPSGTSLAKVFTNSLALAKYSFSLFIFSRGVKVVPLSAIRSSSVVTRRIKSPTPST